MEQLHQSRERKTDLHLHPFKSIKTWRVNRSIIRLGRDRGTIGERLGSDCGANMKEGSGSDRGAHIKEGGA